jgi:hypothetical protein
MTRCSLEEETKKHPSKSLGTTAVCISVISALLVIEWCVELAFAYSRQINPTCGTGCQRIADTLEGSVPLLLIVPLAGWVTAWQERVAVPVARCAALTALAVWITVRCVIWSL